MSSHIVNFSKPTLKLQQYLMLGNTGGAWTTVVVIM